MPEAFEFFESFRLFFWPVFEKTYKFHLYAVNDRRVRLRRINRTYTGSRVSVIWDSLSSLLESRLTEKCAKGKKFGISIFLIKSK